MRQTVDSEVVASIDRGRTALLESHHRWFGDDVLSPRTAERFVEAYGQAGGIIDRQLKAVANNW